jgi:hypothetical protein
MVSVYLNRKFFEAWKRDDGSFERIREGVISVGGGLLFNIVDEYEKLFKL